VQGSNHKKENTPKGSLIWKFKLLNRENFIKKMTALMRSG